MISLDFDSSPETNENQPATTPRGVPRLDSLHHRLQHARDADGRPIRLLNEILFFLDDPPPGPVSNNNNTLTESTKKSAPGTSSPSGRIFIEMSSSYHLIPPHNGISPCPPGRNSIEVSSSYHLIPPRNGISPCPPAPCGFNGFLSIRSSRRREFVFGWPGLLVARVAQRQEAIGQCRVW